MLRVARPLAGSEGEAGKGGAAAGSDGHFADIVVGGECGGDEREKDSETHDADYGWST